MTTTNAITAILSANGFEARRDGSLFWGTGSIMHGYSASVRELGFDTYEVRIHSWSYNCDGDAVYDNERTEALRGPQALALVFHEMPIVQ